LPYLKKVELIKRITSITLSQDEIQHLALSFDIFQSMNRDSSIVYGIYAVHGISDQTLVTKSTFKDCTYGRFVQYSGTCYFNAALNSLFIPIELRNFVINQYLYKYQGASSPEERKRFTIPLSEFREKENGIELFSIHDYFYSFIYHSLIATKQPESFNTGGDIINYLALRLKKQINKKHSGFYKNELMSSGEGGHTDITLNTIMGFFHSDMIKIYELQPDYPKKDITKVDPLSVSKIIQHINSKNSTTIPSDICQVILVRNINCLIDFFNFEDSIVISGVEYKLLSASFHFLFIDTTLNSHAITGYICEGNSYIFDSNNYITPDFWISNDIRFYKEYAKNHYGSEIKYFYIDNIIYLRKDSPEGVIRNQDLAAAIATQDIKEPSYVEDSKIETLNFVDIGIDKIVLKKLQQDFEQLQSMEQTPELQTMIQAKLVDIQNVTDRIEKSRGDIKSLYTQKSRSMSTKLASSRKVKPVILGQIVEYKNYIAEVEKVDRFSFPVTVNNIPTSQIINNTVQIVQSIVDRNVSQEIRSILGDELLKKLVGKYIDQIKQKLLEPSSIAMQPAVNNPTINFTIPIGLKIPVIISYAISDIKSDEQLINKLGEIAEEPFVPIEELLTLAVIYNYKDKVEEIIEMGIQNGIKFDIQILKDIFFKCIYTNKTRFIKPLLQIQGLLQELQNSNIDIQMKQLINILDEKHQGIGINTEIVNYLSEREVMVSNQVLLDLFNEKRYGLVKELLLYTKEPLIFINYLSTLIKTSLKHVIGNNELDNLKEELSRLQQLFIDENKKSSPPRKKQKPTN
jgi:hypothetical protein